MFKNCTFYYKRVLIFVLVLRNEQRPGLVWGVASGGFLAKTTFKREGGGVSWFYGQQISSGENIYIAKTYYT